MNKQELIEEITHYIKCVSGKVFISEMEYENQLKGVMIGIETMNKRWEVPMILDKKELHRFIGVLLHVQAKLK